MQSSEAVQPVEETRGKKVHAALKARLGDDIYTSWFKTLDFDGFDGKTVTASVPVKFLRNWIQSHYIDDLLACSRIEFKGGERVDVQLRQPGGQNLRVVANTAENQRTDAALDGRVHQSPPDQGVRTPPPRGLTSPVTARVPAGGVSGSPLYPHHTFENFIVGAPNRLAHAAAVQAAETVMSGSPGINPLFFHS